MKQMRALFSLLASQAGDELIRAALGSTAIAALVYALYAEATGSPILAGLGMLLVLIIVALIVLPSIADWWLARAPALSVEMVGSAAGPEAVIRVVNSGSTGFVQASGVVEYPAPYPHDQPWRTFVYHWQETDRPSMRVPAGQAGTLRIAERATAARTADNPGFTILRLCGIGDEDRLDSVWVEGEECSAVVRITLTATPPLRASHIVRLRVIGDRNNYDIRAEQMP